MLYAYYGMLLITLITVVFAFRSKIKTKILGLKKRKPSKLTKEASSIYKELFLENSTTTLLKVIVVKVIIFTVVLTFMYAVKYTNIQYFTNKIENDFEYKVDAQFSQKIKAEDIPLAFEQEMRFYHELFDIVTREELMIETQTDVTFTIIGHIEDSKRKSILKNDVLANKIYHRLHDYYAHRLYDHLNYFALALLLTFLTELYFIMKNSYIKSMDRRNLVYLKKLMVINGSIKPIDFMTVLNEMINNATPNIKKKLLTLYEVLVKNDGSTHKLCVELVRASKNTSEKLFYEKIDLACNFDFDQAIHNIKMENSIEKQEMKRKYKSQVDKINIIGVTAFMILICMALMYMFIPWMGLLNFDSMF